MKIFLVIPTIRNLSFLKAWKNSFSECNLIIVEDNPEKNVELPVIKTKSIIHFSWKEIDESLGKDSWIISRRNAGIRSFGFLKAYELGADIIITIDDDCYPVENNFIEKHISNLNFKLPRNWINTYPNTNYLYTRGIPYKNRNKISVVISHGLWSGSIDLDAKTEIKLKNKMSGKAYLDLRQIIPFNYYYPMCSMNLAFKKEITPLMFFPMMGQNPEGERWKYNRFDDIWAGIFSKKIMDHLNLGVINGSPFIEHRRASNVSENLYKEKEGMKINEILWKLVNEVKLSKSSPKDCYIELANKINFPKEEYFDKLRKAMIIWANLF